MVKEKLLAALLLVPLALLAAAPVAAQSRTPIVNVKYSYAGVTRSTTGLFWSSGNPALNFTSALIRVVPTGSPSGCTVKFYTGPTAALATIVADDANASITCTSAVNKSIAGIDNYFNMELTALTGGSSPTVTVYVTLTNSIGQTFNTTISEVTQGGAAADSSDPWPTKLANGSGVDAAYLNEGVGALGAGVLQIGQLSTLSAAVAAATLTEVVAATSGGDQTYIRAILVEKSAGGTGTVTVRYGTGTNCGTGTTTILGPITNPPIGIIPLGILAPANVAVCVITDGTSTGARLLTN